MSAFVEFVKKYRSGDVFEENVHIYDDEYSFGKAYSKVNNGYCIKRRGWNKGMYIKMVTDINIDGVELEKFLVIKNTKGTFNT